MRTTNKKLINSTVVKNIVKIIVFIALFYTWDRLVLKFIPPFSLLPLLFFIILICFVIKWRILYKRIVKWLCKIETIIFFFLKEETITFRWCKIKEICITEWECLCLEHGRMPHLCAFTSIFKKEQRKQNALAYSKIGL